MNKIKSKLRSYLKGDKFFIFKLCPDDRMVGMWRTIYQQTYFSKMEYWVDDYIGGFKYGRVRYIGQGTYIR